MATCFTIGGAEFCEHHQRQNTDAIIKRCLVYTNGREVLRQFTFFKRFARSFRSFFSGITAVEDSSNLGCEDFLRFVDFRTTKLGQLCNLIHWQRCVELEEAFYVRIFSVTPVLPEIISAQHIGIQPDCTAQ